LPSPQIGQSEGMLEVLEVMNWLDKRCQVHCEIIKSRWSENLNSMSKLGSLMIEMR
jgi:hypothetical protein